MCVFSQTCFMQIFPHLNISHWTFLCIRDIHDDRMACGEREDFPIWPLWSGGETSK